MSGLMVRIGVVSRSSARAWARPSGVVKSATSQLGQEALLVGLMSTFRLQGLAYPHILKGLHIDGLSIATCAKHAINGN